jgi:hypothetical protein
VIVRTSPPEMLRAVPDEESDNAAATLRDGYRGVTALSVLKGGILLLP